MTLIRSPSRSRTSHDAASSSTVCRSPWTSAMTLIRTEAMLPTSTDPTPTVALSWRRAPARRRVLVAPPRARVLRPHADSVRARARDRGAGVVAVLSGTAAHRLHDVAGARPPDADPAARRSRRRLGRDHRVGPRRVRRGGDRATGRDRGRTRDLARPTLAVPCGSGRGRPRRAPGAIARRPRRTSCPPRSLDVRDSPTDPIRRTTCRSGVPTQFGKGHCRAAKGRCVSGAARSRVSTRSRRGSRREPGTNPEELIAAAHAGCFSMALSGALGRNETPPTKVSTTAKVHLDKAEVGFAITLIELITEAEVPGDRRGRVPPDRRGREVDAVRCRRCSRGPRSRSSAKLRLDRRAAARARGRRRRPRGDRSHRAMRFGAPRAVGEVRERTSRGRGRASRPRDGRRRRAGRPADAVYVASGRRRERHVGRERHHVALERHAVERLRPRARVRARSPSTPTLAASARRSRRRARRVDLRCRRLRSRRGSRRGTCGDRNSGARPPAASISAERQRDGEVDRDRLEALGRAVRLRERPPSRT